MVVPSFLSVHPYPKVILHPNAAYLHKNITMSKRSVAFELLSFSPSFASDDQVAILMPCA